MNTSENFFSEEEINLEVERLRKEELEQKVKEELFEKEAKEKELQDEMENFLVKFFDNNGVISREDNEILIYIFKGTFDDFFWKRLEVYGGFSKCPTCNSYPCVIRFTEGIYLPLKNGKIFTGVSSWEGIIKSVQCCEHLFDFTQKKRYIKLNETPFKDNKFIETIKYVSLTEINKEKNIYTVDKFFIKRIINHRPKERNDYLNWEEYIPYIEEYKLVVEIPKQEDENVKAKSIAISKQRKEIEILERLLSEAKEKLKSLEN